MAGASQSVSSQEEGSENDERPQRQDVSEEQLEWGAFPGVLGQVDEFVGNSAFFSQAEEPASAMSERKPLEVTLGDG